jgi:hypothetical protein
MIYKVSKFMGEHASSSSQGGNAYILVLMPQMVPGASPLG